MNSIKFPDMFLTTSTKVVKDYEATLQNIITLLCSEKGQFIDDPYFGMRIKRYVYNQNNLILRDLIIDEIYTQLKTFIPQLTCNRKDITITFKRGKLYANIKAINNLDFTTNMYNLVLFSEVEE